MLHVGQNAREDRSERVVDGRKDLARAQHASRAALRDKDAARRQLRLDHGPVEVLRVELRAGRARMHASDVCIRCPLHQQAVGVDLGGLPRGYHLHSLHHGRSLDHSPFTMHTYSSLQGGESQHASSLQRPGESRLIHRV